MTFCNTHSQCLIQSPLEKLPRTTDVEIHSQTLREEESLNGRSLSNPSPHSSGNLME